MRHGDLQWYATSTLKRCGSPLIYIFVQLVEVKSGETFNGTLNNCDIWMNLHLVDVIQTSAVQ